jgi:hypothetical protein
MRIWWLNAFQPWITPSLFDGTMDDRIIDEYTFGQYMDKEEGRQILQRHWDTWITEKDFEAISRAGYFWLFYSKIVKLLTVHFDFYQVESRPSADRLLGIRYQWR